MSSDIISYCHNKSSFDQPYLFRNEIEKYIYSSVYTLQMMRERKTFIRRIKQGDNVRYAEVWNERRGKKVIQHHVRYLGSDPNNPVEPSSFDIENTQFEYLSGQILNESLSAEDIIHMLDASGNTVNRKDIREVVIRYNLDEKRVRLQLVFPRKTKDSA